MLTPDLNTLISLIPQLTTDLSLEIINSGENINCIFKKKNCNFKKAYGNNIQDYLSFMHEH